ncbi:SUKH-4 family immunity protein [Nocardioides rubriscoriae]|uniref:SUKH-4 family immunity protein n=1 Tax=Nocardioides rubriscoriae TaxID=642762 RepID=UPI0011DF272D|nr:SUKH-4 family immunity protein [Nocardioides rubriscoriae]
MLTDDDIITALADVLPLDESLEAYPGTWQEPPYADRDGRALLGLGDRSWDVLLDRETGRLEGVPDDADAFVLNSSLERFVRCVQVAVAAHEEVGRYEAETVEDDDLDEEVDDEAVDEIEEIGRRLAKQLAEIDPEAVADENAFWSVLAEELSYGS